MTLGDLYAADGELIDLYGECRFKHAQLVRAINQKQPTKDPKEKK